LAATMLRVPPKTSFAGLSLRIWHQKLTNLLAIWLNGSRRLQLEISIRRPLSDKPMTFEWLGLASDERRMLAAQSPMPTADNRLRYGPSCERHASTLEQPSASPESGRCGAHIADLLTHYSGQILD